MEMKFLLEAGVFDQRGIIERVEPSFIHHIHSAPAKFTGNGEKADGCGLMTQRGLSGTWRPCGRLEFAIAAT